MSFGGDASRGRGHIPPAGGIPRARGRTLPVGDIPRVRGRSLPVGDIPRARGRDSCPRRRRMPPLGALRTPPCRMSPAARSVPALGDTHPASRNCPRRRGTSLWTVSPQIEDVLFDRGLRSPTEGDGPGAVVWGRSTSWVQNAVPDGPGRLRGAVVGAGLGRPDNLVVVFTASTGARCPRWTYLPVPGCSGIGFAPWLQDDASTPPLAPRLCASGPRSRARPTTNRPELGSVPTPPVPPTGPPDVG